MTHGAPIFIGGMFKSGTTLLRAMIGQHSRIAAGLETYWFDLKWAAPHDQSFNERIRTLADFYDFDLATLETFVAESDGVVTFMDKFLGAFAERMGKNRWAEKTPGNVTHMDRVLAGWPNARIIHIIRDPRDVLASLREAGKWDSINEFTERWCAFLAAAETHKSQPWLGDHNYLEIRYETLTFEPEPTMRKIIEFVGEAWEPKVARFEGKDGDFTKVLGVTGKSSTTLLQLREPLTKSRVGNWRRVLDEKEIAEMHRAITKRGLGKLLARIEAGTPRHAAV